MRQQTARHMATSVCLVPKLTNSSVGRATGFLVDALGKLYLVTNWHVLENKNVRTRKPIKKPFHPPASVEVNHPTATGVQPFTLPLLESRQRTWRPSKDIDRMPDVAVLEVDRKRFDPVLHIFGCPADFLEKVPPSGEEIKMAGFPTSKTNPGDWPCERPVQLVNNPWAYNRGTADHFEISVNDGPGMSGAPVYTKDNRLLGVYSGHDDDNLKYVFGVRSLISLLERLKA